MIRSVTRKFLRVPKSHDYDSRNRNNLHMTNICDVRLQSFIRKVANFMKIYCENVNPDQNGK